MRIALIGSLGFAGSAAAKALAARPEVEKLLLADYNVTAAKKLAKKLGRDKCVHAMVDAAKDLEMERVLDGADAAAIAVGPGRDYDRAVLLACAGRRVPAASLGDAAYSPDAREIDSAFRASGTAAVHGCGLLPGFTEILAAHFLPSAKEGDATEPFLLFSPDRFGGYAFWRHLALAGLVPVQDPPPGLPEGAWFRAGAGGTLVGLPPGKAGGRAKLLLSLFSPFGPVGTEFAGAFLHWTRNRMKGDAALPAAVAGVLRTVAATGKVKCASVSDPAGDLAGMLLADCAVRLGRGDAKRKGLLPIAELYDRKAAEALASAARCAITVNPA